MLSLKFNLKFLCNCIKQTEQGRTPFKELNLHKRLQPQHNCLHQCLIKFLENKNPLTTM